MGSVVTSATPAFMLIFAVWLLKEKITLRKILSVILATVGVIMIAGVDNMDFDKQLGVLFFYHSSIDMGIDVCNAKIDT